MKVYIKDIAENGDGIGQIQNGENIGKIAFVEGAKYGEIVRIKEKRVLKNRIIGEKKELLEKSNKLINQEEIVKLKNLGIDITKEDPSAILKEIKINEQTRLKENKLKHLMKNIIKKEILKKVKIRDGKESEKYNYRNKGRFKLIQNSLVNVQIKDGKIRYINIKNSILMSKEINICINVLNDVFKEKEINKLQILKYIYEIEIRSNNINQVQILYILKDIDKINKKREKEGIDKQIIKINENLEKKIKEIEISSIYYMINNNIKKIKGEEFLDIIGDKKYYITPGVFFQVNKYETKELYNQIREKVKLLSNNNTNINVLDLYCGAGTISIYISDLVNKVVGVEVVEKAIENGKKNLKLNNIQNVELYHGKSEEIFKKYISDKEILILDPPRAGLKQKLCEDIIESEINNIIYISCNPNTLARDLKILKEKYDIIDLDIIDMFPNTLHMECITVLKLKNN